MARPSIVERAEPAAREQRRRGVEGFAERRAPAFGATFIPTVGARLLEIGCGTGAIARVLAAWPGVGEVLGVDPSPILLTRARELSEGIPNLSFEEGDGRRLALRA